VVTLRAVRSLGDPAPTPSRLLPPDHERSLDIEPRDRWFGGAGVLLAQVSL
jgi:hypothetical protein